MEGKILRRQEREAAEERRRDKELERLAASKPDNGDRDDVLDYDDNADNDVEEEETDKYQPSSKGHERVWSKTVKLEVDKDKYRKTFSLQSDHRLLSSRGRCDVLSEQVMSGGADLRSLPCSKTTMIRFSKLRD